MKKAIFITGAASGIGRATARLFAKQGFYPGLFDLDESGLEDLVWDNHHPMMDRLGVNLGPEAVAEVVAKAARGSGPHYLVSTKIKLLSAVLGWLPQRPGRELYKRLVGY